MGHVINLVIEFSLQWNSQQYLKSAFLYQQTTQQNSASTILEI